MTICAEWDEVYRLTLFSGCKIEKMWWLKKLGWKRICSREAASRSSPDHDLQLRWVPLGGGREMLFWLRHWALFGMMRYYTGWFFYWLRAESVEDGKIPTKKVSVKTSYFPVAYQATTSWFFTVTHCHNSHYFKVRVLCLSVELWDKRFSSIC